jgi:hypothetical protein
MKRLWLLAFLAGCASLAAAQDTIELLPSPLKMPRRIGPLVFDGQPHSFPSPELGIGYQYNSDGLSLTIYVYDLGIKDIPDGANTVATCQQFEEAKEGVIQARYPNTVLKTEQLVRLSPPDDQPQAREAVFEFTMKQRSAFSYVWITGVAGNFIKLRFSVDADLKDEVPDARRAILTAVGEAVKPYLAPPAATEEKKGKEGGTTININSLGGSQDDLTTSMMYLMFVSALAEKDPGAAPPCGGTLVPSFEIELSAFQSLVQSEATNKSAFGQKLVAIEKAGFLEEFVWMDRHRDEWGDATPGGLTPGDYKKWRKKNLRNFNVPDFGSVGVEQVRMLPLEPASAP